MNVLVTGGSGFIASHAIPHLLERGHHVRVLLRPTEAAPAASWLDHPNVEVRRAALESMGEAAEPLRGVDAIVHLAATRSKSWTEQRVHTVDSTRHFVGAASKIAGLHFVLVGSFAVYDYTGPRAGSDITEESPLATDFAQRGPYCWAKREQEEILLAASRDTGLLYTILRLGAVYGPGAEWTHRLGIRRKRLWVRMGADAPLPLAHVLNVSQAIALSIEREKARNTVLNVVDDHCPSQRQYMEQLWEQSESRPLILPVGFHLIRTIATAVWMLAAHARLRRLLPLTLRPMCVDAMAKPMHYPNDRIKKTLEWRPELSSSSIAGSTAKGRT